MKISFSPPDITEAEIESVSEALRSGWITTGPRTKMFEKKIADYCGTSRAVALNSATAGLELTLKVLGIGRGDEVITSAYTYTASASVIEHIGAKIVLCDTALDSYEMDYEKLEKLIGEKTKAVIPVDIAGKIVDYEKIFKIVEGKKSKFTATNEMQAKFNRVVVLADAAHSFGAMQNGTRSGNIADFTVFSFHAVKNLTTAEGGAVTWRNRENLDNDALYKEYMLWSLHGQTKDALSKTQLGAWEYDIVRLGQKCNMTDVVASIGLSQLERYEGMLSKRRQIIEKLNKSFSKLPIKTLTHFDKRNSSSGHLYLTRIKGITIEERNEIIIKMAEAGISCNVHYKPLPLLTAYKNLGFNIADYPNAYSQYANEITLPLHTLLSIEEVDYIITCYTKIVREYV